MTIKQKNSFLVKCIILSVFIIVPLLIILNFINSKNVKNNLILQHNSQLKKQYSNNDDSPEKTILDAINKYFFFVSPNSEDKGKLLPIAFLYLPIPPESVTFKELTISKIIKDPKSSLFYTFDMIPADYNKATSQILHEKIKADDVNAPEKLASDISSNIGSYKKCVAPTDILSYFDKNINGKNFYISDGKGTKPPTDNAPKDVYDHEEGLWHFKPISLENKNICFATSTPPAINQFIITKLVLLNNKNPGKPFGKIPDIKVPCTDVLNEFTQTLAHQLFNTTSDTYYPPFPLGPEFSKKDFVDNWNYFLMGPQWYYKNDGYQKKVTFKELSENDIVLDKTNNTFNLNINPIDDTTKQHTIKISVTCDLDPSQHLKELYGSGNEVWTALHNAFIKANLVDTPPTPNVSAKYFYNTLEKYLNYGKQKFYNIEGQTVTMGKITENDIMSNNNGTWSVQLVVKPTFNSRIQISVPKTISQASLYSEINNGFAAYGYTEKKLNYIVIPIIVATATLIFLNLSAFLLYKWIKIKKVQKILKTAN